MSDRLVLRLRVLMFLEYFVWGSWFATLGLVLSRYRMAGSIANAFSAGPIAAILSPMLLGVAVDRFISPRGALASMHILGAVLLSLIPLLILSGRSEPMLALLLAYNLVYMPTLSLSNNVTFYALSADQRDFPRIRVFGTAGWAVAGLIVGECGLSDSVWVFWLGAAASLLLGVYAVTLPAASPNASKGLDLGALLFRDVAALLRFRDFRVLCACAALICVPLATYYAYTAPFLAALGIRNVGSVMALGQVSEVFAMLLVPLCLQRLGTKLTLSMGMLAWTLRYAIFALAASVHSSLLAYAGVLLHGICYDFFFVVTFMYTERCAPSGTKGQAQGFIVMLTYGLGLLVGSQLAGVLYGVTSGTSVSPTLVEWQQFWIWPAAAALIVCGCFATLFREVRVSSPVALSGQ